VGSPGPRGVEGFREVRLPRWGAVFWTLGQGSCLPPPVGGPPVCGGAGRRGRVLAIGVRGPWVFCRKSGWRGNTAMRSLFPTGIGAGKGEYARPFGEKGVRR